MKLYMLGLFLILAVAACTAPAEDAPRAEIKDSMDDDTQSDSTTEDSMMDYSEGDMMQENDMKSGIMPINLEKSSFEFEGYGPGKSHVGTFDELSGEVTITDGMITNAKGTIQVSSVNTGISGLDDHLLREDFFDEEKYPIISFESTSITQTEMIGVLNFRGVEKEIIIPVTHEGTTMSADFILDTTPFGMPDNAANKEVRIAFTVSS